MAEDATQTIGEVMNRVRKRFPDVTISKIRFLESQGLLSPERSPSGYRKFSETDVATLEWILGQQRDHFLPLKVIREKIFHSMRHLMRLMRLVLLSIRFKAGWRKGVVIKKRPFYIVLMRNPVC